MNNLKTYAYLPFNSNQDWTVDPEFAVIGIGTSLADLVARGIKVLNDTGFNSIASSLFGVDWDLVILDDNEEGYVSLDPEYTVQAPDITIGSEVMFAFPFKHTSDEGWCSLSFADLAGYLDKAWVESYGGVFVQLPSNEDGTEGKWLCVDPASDAYTEEFAVECDTLMECVAEAADWLEDAIDKSMPGVVLRPEYPELRQMA